jgi:hypothetical protein
MCNRYRASSVVKIRDRFGFTYIESGPPIEHRYVTSGIGPLQTGPASVTVAPPTVNEMSS